MFRYLDPEQLLEELCVDVCEQVVGKVQLGQEVQARETLWIQAGANGKASFPNTTEENQPCNNTSFIGIRGGAFTWK